jgi:hypothetical protein
MNNARLALMAQLDRAAKKWIGLFAYRLLG